MITHWDIYRLLLKLLFLFESDIMRREAESVGFPVMSEVDQRLISHLWTVPGHVGESDYLIPYEDLLKIFL